MFKPGNGAFPPALTGREQQQAVLMRSLTDLSGGRAPPHDIVLTGPRGNGKTVLLQWFERACRDAGGVDVERIAPSAAGLRGRRLPERPPRAEALRSRRHGFALIAWPRT